jgi:hypothetical protein
LIRAVFRFSVFGLASGQAIFVTESEIQEIHKNEPKKSEFDCFHAAVFRRLKGRRVFGFFRVDWFLSSEEIGYLISVIFGFVFNILLLWLLW